MFCLVTWQRKGFLNKFHTLPKFQLFETRKLLIFYIFIFPLSNAAQGTSFSEEQMLSFLLVEEITFINLIHLVLRAVCNSVGTARKYRNYAVFRTNL